MSIIMDLRVEDDAWTCALSNLSDLCQSALNAATASSTTGLQVDVLLTNDEALCQLNKDWRGKPVPTDVLSFPAEDLMDGFAGDIAIAYGVCLRDARTDGKSLSDHLCHLLIHGLLHLLGHDHIEEDEADIMEALEREALGRIGISDPYSRIARN